MFQQFLKWLGTRLFPGETPPPSPQPVGVRVRPPSERPQAAARPAAKPQVVGFRPQVSGKIEDAGPGKNVLVRNRFVREDTGTHETLKILDETLLKPEQEEVGIDPYNTGRFDRAKHWETRFRK
ncbi:MAG TPA: hypothetical protein VF200_09785 [Woeseiaceae bacterium]